jgi:hypothetical protein
VSAQPSEATRLAELDARIARDCERSGVPFFVEDEALLDRVAGLLTDDTLALGTEGRTVTT